ncbi:MAG TPA: hypothetical protein VL944_02300 [Candidatus Acidoferrum sp.]|nr:hypothetical protein [Candidatus Acidoferrum sp.]
MAKKRKTRPYGWIIALVAIVVLLIAVVAISNLYTMPYIKPSSFNSSNISNSMRLTLMIPNQTVAYGSNVSIEVNLFNTASQAYNISTHGYYTQPNTITLGSTSACGNWEMPLGIAVFKGHYNLSSISNGTGELQLWQPGVYFGCPVELISTSYYFWPDSDNATIYILTSGTNTTKYATIPIQTTFVVGGYWSNSGLLGNQYAFNKFPIGNYTVVAGNGYWKQYTVGYFEVV